MIQQNLETNELKFKLTKQSTTKGQQWRIAWQFKVSLQLTELVCWNRKVCFTEKLF